MLRYFLLICLMLFPSLALGQDGGLADQNGDEIITLLAFGDSLTAGVGGENGPGDEIDSVMSENATGGYVRELSALLGVSVLNAGIPGERFTDRGISRFPTAISSGRYDAVVILEGSNDALIRIDASAYRRNLQRAVNVTKASGLEPLVTTIPPTCCNRIGQAPIISSYNAEARRIASLNSTRLVDFERGWRFYCGEALASCPLLNIPEGLHPNRLGYEFMAQMVGAVVLGIDLFAPGGAEQLEELLGLEDGTILLRVPSVVDEQG